VWWEVGIGFICCSDTKFLFFLFPSLVLDAFLSLLLVVVVAALTGANARPAVAFWWCYKGSEVAGRDGGNGPGKGKRRNRAKAACTGCSVQ
jgi:hypothetical protein